MEEGLIDGARSIQVGIRGPLYGPEDFDFHREHGFEVIRIEDVKERGVAAVVERLRRLAGGPVYCSFDVDACDPAYAPGTGTPEAGGLTSYEALGLVRGLRGLDSRRRHRRVLAALRRARRHNGRAGREPALRAALGGGAGPLSAAAPRAKMAPVRSALHRPLPVVAAILLVSSAVLLPAGPAAAASSVSLIEWTPPSRRSRCAC